MLGTKPIRNWNEMSHRSLDAQQALVPQYLQQTTIVFTYLAGLIERTRALLIKTVKVDLYLSYVARKVFAQDASIFLNSAWLTWHKWARWWEAGLSPDLISQNDPQNYSACSDPHIQSKQVKTQQNLIGTPAHR